GRPRSRRAAEQRDEVAAYHLGHGACSPRFAPTKAMAVRLVCRPSRVSRSGRQVLGQHLKCSESRGGWEGGFICRAQSGGEGPSYFLRQPAHSIVVVFKIQTQRKTKSSIPRRRGAWKTFNAKNRSKLDVDLLRAQQPTRDGSSSRKLLTRRQERGISCLRGRIPGGTRRVASPAAIASFKKSAYSEIFVFRCNTFTPMEIQMTVGP